MNIILKTDDGCIHTIFDISVINETHSGWLMFIDKSGSLKEQCNGSTIEYMYMSFDEEAEDV